MLTCSVLTFWCLVAVLLKPTNTIDSLNNAPLDVIDQSSGTQTRYPSPKDKHKHKGSDNTVDSSNAPVPQTPATQPAQLLDQLHATHKFDNLTQPSTLSSPELPLHTSFYPYRLERNQYHFSPHQPLPIPPFQEAPILTQAPKPTPTYKKLVPQYQDIITQSNYNHRHLVRRDQQQSWPGTDTVYATKTVFISQPGQPTTVFVSNGQIINPPQPTPCTLSCNNNNGQPWVSPSGNPNIVVATVTAYSSAKKLLFTFDSYTRSFSYLSIFFLVHLFFTSFGFRLVHLVL